MIGNRSVEYRDAECTEQHGIRQPVHQDVGLFTLDFDKLRKSEIKKREKWIRGGGAEQPKESELSDERVAVTCTSLYFYSTRRYIHLVQMTKPVIVRKCNWQRVRGCIRVTERLSSTLCDSFLVTIWILLIYLRLAVRSKHKICMLYFILINSVILNLLCVQILFQQPNIHSCFRFFSLAVNYVRTAGEKTKKQTK